MACEHLNVPGVGQPFKNLYANVSIVPANCRVAYISSTYASDEEGNLIKGMEGDYYRQSKKVWEDITAILKHLGATVHNIAQREVFFLEFNEEIAKAAVQGCLDGVPEEWKAEVLKSSLTYHASSHPHLPGVVYLVDLTVALPN